MYLQARLVSIQDQFENDYVNRLSNGNAVWIGLHDKYVSFYNQHSSHS